jgi:hypothetical protein
VQQKQKQKIKTKTKAGITTEGTEDPENAAHGPRKENTPRLRGVFMKD